MRKIQIGNVLIGGGERIAIQSMTTTKTHDIESTKLQIAQLQDAGCDIIRVAIKDMQDAKALKIITEFASCPIVADIHFDYKLAISSIENGAAKVRINPGNIGSENNVKILVDCLKMHNVPLRIGVNAGSLEKSVKDKHGVNADALVMSAINNVKMLEKWGYNDIVVSVKASNVKTTVEAYRSLKNQIDYPLHLGVTEAGTYSSAIVKSSVALGSLLLDGIGDTIRVSITGDPIREVHAARDILRAVGLEKNFVEVISCPTCGRCDIPLEEIATAIEQRTRHIKKSLKVAVMGCVVNGIGEGECADIGLAGGKDEGVIFRHGKIVKKVSSENMVDELLHMICEM